MATAATHENFYIASQVISIHYRTMRFMLLSSLHNNLTNKLLKLFSNITILDWVLIVIIAIFIKLPVQKNMFDSFWWHIKFFGDLLAECGHT